MVSVMLILILLLAFCSPSLAENLERGSYQIKIPTMVSPANAQNAVLAGEYLNGTIVEAGEVFSYNQTVGQRTSDRGFIAGMISSRSKKAVYSIGGGVCTTASILHQAVKASGLEVIERHNHVAPTSYLPQGEDAAIWYGVEDYRFRNNLENSIRIDAGVADNALKISIVELQPDYSKPVIVVNGQTINGCPALINQDGILMVPIRAAAQALGAEVHWDSAVQRIAIKYHSSVIRLEVSNDMATIEGEPVTLESEVLLWEGNTMVPASILTSAFDISVETDLKQKRTVISSDDTDMGWQEKKYFENDLVFIPDPGLEQAVRCALDKPEGHIRTEDMLKINVLDAAGRDISCLKGLEYAINLQSIDLADNLIEDISPSLPFLSHLQIMDLSDNCIRSLSVFFDPTGRMLLGKGCLLYLGGNQLNLENPEELAKFDLLNNAGIVVDFDRPESKGEDTAAISYSQSLLWESENIILSRGITQSKNSELQVGGGRTW